MRRHGSSGCAPGGASVAGAEEVPAFVVFGDRTLRELARRNPATTGALVEVPGIGPAKLARYGDDLLRVLAGAARVIQHPSASFAFTARCRIVNRPGMLGQLTSAIGSLGGDIRGIDIVRVDRGAIVRDVTVLAADEDHAQQLVEMMKALAGHRGPRLLRPHLPRPPRRQDRGGGAHADPHPRGPLDGVHAGRGAHQHGHRRRPLARAQPHHQAQLRGHRHRRQRGARARQHRTRGGAAGHGGQGHALQGVRQRRRLPAVPGDPGRRRDRRHRRQPSRRPSAASTSRTSPGRAASRWRSGCRRCSTSRSSTTTSTAPRSSCSPRSSTRSRS